MGIDSKLITLEDIEKNNFFFNIPIYQRLYVWEDTQIKTLLEDIQSAYSNNENDFYLGGVLVVEKETIGDVKIFDLIDGQQRFTTLWMIAIELEKSLSPFIERSEKDKNRHRVTFSIRDDIYKFFKVKINDNMPNEDEVPPNILNAMSLIASHKWGSQEDKISEESEEDKIKDKISEFIYKKTKMIFTEMPKETDLNKLFELINNRGVQLQHHEILKAKLLSRISNNEDRQKYSYLWDACSYIDSYLEKNIKDIANISIQDIFDDEGLSNPQKIIEKIKVENSQNSSNLNKKDLINILENDPDQYNNESNIENDEYEADDVRSILTFPMLLQHTLRIFLLNKKESDITKILDKDLLSIFSSKNFSSKTDLNRTDNDIKCFIELLWKVRYFFDKHVIKWVRQEDGESHLICKLEKYTKDGKDYLRRSLNESSAGEALLQSMLYHSQQITTHYWLTPYLNYLLNHEGSGSYEYLKCLDNYLFSSKEPGSLIERTRKFLDDENYKPELLDIDAEDFILKQSLGTDFPHYWFYKLEYILWEQNNSTDDKWKNFKMTAKNSVEHISPRERKDSDTNTVSEKTLNNFGNLALVSRSVNSIYSNLPFNEKRQRFINNNNIKLDSLKMALIYKNETWDDTKAIKHQEEMIKKIKDYIEDSNKIKKD